MSSSNLELLKSFRKNTEWFDNNYHSLKKYDGQFIAIHKESVVDYDNDYQSLIQRIKRLYDRSLYVTLLTRHGTVSPVR
jgi:cobalamin biosynthesis Co2+ chelatase CbiK